MIYSWQQAAWDQLVKTRNNKHLSHALLISGASGTGKYAFATALVNSLLCESQLDDYQACGKCKSCKVHQADAHPDYQEVILASDKTQIVVDQIRSLTGFLHKSRSYNGYRVVFISPAESLNINAANSLLKSLEEPADNSVIILLTSQSSALLPTIRSRCQQLQLPLPNKKSSLEWLSQQSTKHSPEELLDMAGGRPLAALKLDESTLFESRNEFAGDLSAVLMQQKTITEASKTWQSSSKKELLDWQINWVQQLIKQKSSTSSQKPVLNIRKEFELNKLWVLYDELLVFKGLAHTSLNAQLFVENMLLSWLKL